MRALYDLSRYLPSFNFFEWLVQAEADGATEVVFDVREIRAHKWPADVSRERFKSICIPGPALIGLPYSIVDGDLEGARDFGEPGGSRIVRFCKAGRKFKRLRTVKEPGLARYTVTLRHTQRAEGRNSHREIWSAFAAEIGAHVIPDYDEMRIHLHDRMALYAGARMNFFVSNGPGILCSLSEYPCMMFNTNHAAGSLLGDGLRIGDQYPWMLANQRAVWDDATPESLRAHFEHWDRTGTFLADDERQLDACRKRYGR
jgi:hypothetical protein